MTFAGNQFRTELRQWEVETRKTRLKKRDAVMPCPFEIQLISCETRNPLPVAEGDPAACEVVGRELDGDAIAG